MNRLWIRRLVIAGAFVISFLFFSVFLNQGTTDMTMEMKKASLPLANIYLDGQKVNEMHGYIHRMNEGTMRDSITPITQERNVTFQIEKFGEKVEEIYFEVRSADGERLIEETRVAVLEEDQNTITGSVELKDLIDKNTEYHFILILKLEKNRTVYYYTRVYQCDNSFAREKVEFISDFHNKTFDKEQAVSLSKYLEPDKEGDNTTFGKVNIHSSLNQIRWGEMPVKEITEPSITICEISEQTMAATLDFMVQVKEGKITNLYRVSEYYRIRYTPERVYLLSYERTMEEMFSMDRTSFANNKIVLGIQETECQMLESDGGSILSFENAGRVYSYNTEENKFARLYAFFDEDNFDKRTYYDQSAAKILDVEENGNVLFMVYGYMNRGTHEGEVGVEICYYNSLLNTIEEQIFLANDQSQKILINDMENFSYVNRNGNFYILTDGTIYQIDIHDKSYQEVVSGLNADSYRISESGEMIVWQQEKEPYESKTLVLMNLNTQKISRIDAGAGERIKPLGFMNDDIIYGIAKDEDITCDTLGSVSFLMNRVIIQSQQNDILKEYSGKEEFYITDLLIEENQITLKRMKKTEDDGGLVRIEDDQITSNAKNQSGTNQITEAVTNLYETIWQIELKKEMDVKTIKFLTPKEVLYEGVREITIQNEYDTDRFIVYAYGKVAEIYSNVADAVLYAYNHAGTVMDLKGNEIYKKGELSVRNQIMAIKEEQATDEKSSLSVCLDTILQYEGISKNTEPLLQRRKSSHEILESNLKNCYVMNLTGCTVDTILYYVNQDIPVLSVLNDGTAVLIIGFNQQNTVLMDPSLGTIYKKGINDSKELFEQNGNRFMTYVYKNNKELD